jgi:23S rRNA pseudoU1915 N3-methylase RlmH
MGNIEQLAIGLNLKEYSKKYSQKYLDRQKLSKSFKKFELDLKRQRKELKIQKNRNREEFNAKFWQKIEEHQELSEQLKRKGKSTERNVLSRRISLDKIKSPNVGFKVPHSSRKYSIGNGLYVVPRDEAKKFMQLKQKKSGSKEVKTQMR